MRFSKAILVLILFGLVLNCAMRVQAQNATILNANAIANDRSVKPNWKVSILFDTGFNGADLSRVRIEESGSGNPVPVIRTEYPTAGVVNLIIAQANLTAGVAYHVFVTASSNTPSGKTEYLDMSVAFRQSDKPPLFARAPSDTKEESDIYLSGEGTTARGAKPTFSAEIKIKPPFAAHILRDGDVVSPFFELNTSTNPKADPDTMGFGGELKTVIYENESENAPLITDMFWKNAVKIESDRSFTNTNALWDTRLHGLIKPIPIGKSTLVFNPFIGNELGVNLKSPLAAARHQGIERPLAGATFKLVLPVGQPVLNKIVLEGSYIRRWPLKKEITFDEDENGNITTLTFGKSPRDFADAKFNIKFTKFFGSYIGYEWGQAPPSYKLVDSRVKFGFSYKFSLKHPE